MGFGWLRLDDGLPVCRRQGEGGRAVWAWVPARPAGDTCSSARGASSCVRLGLRGGRRVGGAGLGQRLLERVVAEHRALEPSRADVDAEEVEEVVGAEGLDVGDGLALDLVGQEARAGLADRAAAAGEPDALDDAVADPELERDPVAAQRVAALEGRGRIVDDPEVVAPPEASIESGVEPAA